jgi:ornithine cyclodeaminase/alanine dehydrogenase-like protein (mu-crystallin family)
MLILSNEDAEALLTMSDCITAIEQAYLEYAHGRAANAVRSDAVSTTEHPNAVYSLKLMGAVAPSLGVSVLRLNSDIISFGEKRQVKLPLAPGNRYTGLVLLFSINTGEPLAIFPDGVLQCMRVGATSALATKTMARKNPRIAGIIGAGWQAIGHLKAITALHQLDEIRCYSPTRDKLVAFCSGMSELTGVAVIPAPSPEAAVKGADIVLCATNASQHVFKELWLEPGMHVCTIRGPELEPGVVAQSDLVAVNDRVTHENFSVTKGVTLPKNRHSISGLDPKTTPTLGDLIAGLAPGRVSDAQKSCFVNLPGIGLQFAAVGAVLYQKALAAKRGHELPTEWFTEDVVP